MLRITRPSPFDSPAGRANDGTASKSVDVPRESIAPPSDSKVASDKDQRTVAKARAPRVNPTAVKAMEDARQSVRACLVELLKPGFNDVNAIAELFDASGHIDTALKPAKPADVDSEADEDDQAEDFSSGFRDAIRAELQGKSDAELVTIASRASIFSTLADENGKQMAQAIQPTMDIIAQEARQAQAGVTFQEPAQPAVKFHN